MNSEKQFLKVPKNWENVGWEARNIYVAYLWLKRYSRFGRVHKSSVPMRHFGHWVNKLISSGFVKREGDFYLLISYERVWEILGIKKVNCRGKLCYRWRKLPEYYTTWYEFKKNIITDIQGYQTERKKAQFRKRFSLGDSPDKKGVNYCPLFSSKAVAKLFGYKSAVTGSKYRDKYFDVVKEPLFLRKKYTSDGLPYFQYDCKRIMLKTVFHEC